MKKNKNNSVKNATKAAKEAAKSMEQVMDSLSPETQEVEASKEEAKEKKLSKKELKEAEARQQVEAKNDTILKSKDMTVDQFCQNLEKYLETEPMKALSIEVVKDTLDFVVNATTKYSMEHPVEVEAASTVIRHVEMNTSSISHSHSCIAQAIANYLGVELSIVAGDGSAHSKKFEVKGNLFKVVEFITILKFTVRRFDVLVRKFIDGLTVSTAEKREERKKYIKDFIEAIGFEFKGEAQSVVEPKPEKPKKEPKSKKVVAEAEKQEEGEVVFEDNTPEEVEQDKDLIPNSDDEFEA